MCQCKSYLHVEVLLHQPTHVPLLGHLPWHRIQLYIRDGGNHLCIHHFVRVLGPDTGRWVYCLHLFSMSALTWAPLRRAAAARGTRTRDLSMALSPVHDSADGTRHTPAGQHHNPGSSTLPRFSLAETRHRPPKRRFDSPGNWPGRLAEVTLK